MLGLLARHSGESDAHLFLGDRSSAPAWRTIYKSADEVDALRYLQANSERSDPIFVGVADHSRVFWTDLRMYWLANHPIGVRTFQLETHVATEAPVQKQIIEDLERNKVKWVILDRNSYVGDEVRDYQGSRLLDEYIASHFHEDKSFGQYVILTRVP